MEIGPYQVREELARGGAGVVYRAVHPSGEEVAVKLLLAGQSATPAQRQRFLNEARALARQDHPHVMPVLDVGECPQGPYLVMPLVQGHSLQERLDTQGPLSPREAARILSAVAAGLHHAHQHSVLHRDVKPDNVVLADLGKILLTDFGLAKDLAAESQNGLTHSGVFLGTPGYWSPEQAAGELSRLGPPTDVYGLGATLYAALTGRPPFDAKNLAELLAAPHEQEVTPPSQLRPGLPQELDVICLRCLRRRPEERYPDAGVLSRELQAFAQRKRSALAEHPPSPSRAPLATAGAILLLGLVLSGWLLLGTTASPPSPAAAPSPASPQAKAEARRHLAEAERLMHDPDLGPMEREVEQALQLDPGLARAWSLRAFSRANRRQVEQAHADQQRALQLDPQEPLAICLRGSLMMVEGRIQDGLVDVERAIELEPDRAGNYVARGKARRYLKDYAGSQADLDHALELEPQLWQALEERAALRIQTGDHTGAREDLERAIAIRPTAQALRMRALEQLGAGQLEPALADLDQALKLAPDYAATHDTRGLTLRRLKRNEEAVAEFDAAIRLDPDYANYYLNRALANQALERYPQALADVERAQELGATSATAWISRGEVLNAMDRRDEALAAFQRATEIGPRDFEPWLFLGQYQRKLGHTAEARQALQRALELGPQHPLASSARAMLASLDH